MILKTTFELTQGKISRYFGTYATLSTFINITSKRIRKSLLEFISTSIGLVWHGRLFRFIHSRRLLKLGANDSPKLPVMQAVNNPRNVS